MVRPRFLNRIEGGAKLVLDPVAAEFGGVGAEGDFVAEVVEDGDRVEGVRVDRGLPRGGRLDGSVGRTLL